MRHAVLALWVTGYVMMKWDGPAPSWSLTTLGDAITGSSRRHFLDYGSQGSQRLIAK